MMHYAQVLWRHPCDEIPTRDMSFGQLMDSYIYPSSNYDNEPKNGDTRVPYKCIHVSALRSYLKHSTEFPEHVQFVVYMYAIDMKTQQPCGRAFMLGNDLPTILQRIVIENNFSIRKALNRRYEVVGVWYEYSGPSEETLDIDQVINGYCHHTGCYTTHADLYNKLSYPENSFNLCWTEEPCSIISGGSVKLGYWVGHVIYTLRLCETVADLSRYTKDPTFDFPDDAPDVQVSFDVFTDESHVTKMTHGEFCKRICDSSMAIVVTVRLPGLLEEMPHHPLDNCPITIMAMALSSSPKIIRNVISEPTEDGFIYDIVATATIVPGDFVVVKETVAPDSFITPS